MKPNLVRARKFSPVFLASVVLLFGFKAFAWGDLGHETTADIAEQILSTDAKTMTAIRNIIGVEPLAVSSTWPDKVRSDERFEDFRNYHFYTMFRDPKEVSEKNALTVLQKYPGLLTDPNAPRESKMIALRYIVHVMGDIHQPLHVGNEFDYGGNSCQIKFQSKAGGRVESNNLHSFWDTDLVNYVAEKLKSSSTSKSSYYGYKQVADGLMVKHKNLISSTDKSVDVMSWIKESSELRKTVVYPDQIADDARPYCARDRKSIGAEDIPLLDENYVSKAGDLAEKRMVLGGVRLASLLKKIFSASRSTNPTELEILNLLKLSNDGHGH